MTNFSSVDAGGSANPAEAPSSRPKAWTTVAPSEFVNYRANPIREIVDNIQKQPRNLDKELLSLSIGTERVIHFIQRGSVFANPCCRQATRLSTGTCCRRMC